MKNLGSFLLLFVSLSFILLPASAKAAMWDVPVGPGESFRWVFVTSLRTDAMSADIEYYNNFINDDVMGLLAGMTITGIAGKSYLGDIHWSAIASTQTTWAIENIGGYTPTPIYNTHADLIAFLGVFDLFASGPIPGVPWYTEAGDQVNDLVWTGSTGDGYPASGVELGKTSCTIGRMPLFYPGGWIWMDFGVFPSFEQLPLYAISEELTVIPMPGSLLLAATGLLSSTLGLKRLNCKR